MNIFAKGVLKKVDKEYRKIEKLCEEYPGCTCFVVIECLNYSEDAIKELGAHYHVGLLGETTHIVLDEDKRLMYDFRRQRIMKNKYLHVYDAFSRKIGTVTKKERLIKGNQVTVNKGDLTIFQLSDNNKTNSDGLKYKHAILGTNYDVFQNEKLVVHRDKGTDVFTIAITDKIKEVDGILLAAAMKLLYTDSNTGGGDGGE